MSKEMPSSSPNKLKAIDEGDWDDEKTSRQLLADAILRESLQQGTYEDLFGDAASSHYNDGSHSTAAGALSHRDSLARDETRAVRWLRVLVFGFLTLVAVACCVAVYVYSSNQQSARFENEFRGQGLKVIDGFRADAYAKLQALESLGTTVTSYALESGSTFPFVTIPDSARKLEPYLSLAGAASLLIMPVVPTRLRSAWERYAVENQDWIDNDLKIQQYTHKDYNYTRRLYERTLQINSDTLREQEESEVSWYIKNYVGIDTSPGDWVVWWQYAPVLPNKWFVNFNRLAVPGFQKELKGVRQHHKAVLSRVWTFDQGVDFQSTRDTAFYGELLNQRNASSDYEAGEPVGYIHYPIFDRYEHTEQPQERPTVVAILTATVYWKTYFESILPDTVEGIVAVVTNTLGQVFSYRIDGPKATFLGLHDHHDPRYDHQSLEAEYSLEGASDYTGVPLEDSYLSYKIRIYPSADFEAQYTTNQPIAYAVAMMFVFVFTALVFSLYDYYGERRHDVVLTNAVQSNAVVSSLFPETVRSQIMEQAQHQQSQQQRNSSRNDANAKRTREVAFLLQHSQEFSQALLQPSPVSLEGEPIAHLYEDTTIYFADLAGFTAWSAQRTPVEVFRLLECVYGAMDKVAKRRKVFKVETIGDCYVAATGIPKPQKNHASTMVRFARDCMSETRNVLLSLVETLGEDTQELQMRTGMHSGSTTAGVLRGEKGRFQLFGDTVNTASRMESNGTPGRIHVSQATADALVECGKQSWLEPREDKIVAKGKGEMQTYWVQIDAASMSCSSRSAGRTRSDDPSMAADSDDGTNRGENEANQETGNGKDTDGGASPP